MLQKIVHIVVFGFSSLRPFAVPNPYGGHAFLTGSKVLKVPANGDCMYHTLLAFFLGWNVPQGHEIVHEFRNRIVDLAIENVDKITSKEKDGPHLLDFSHSAHSNCCELYESAPDGYHRNFEEIRSSKFKDFQRARNVDEWAALHRQDRTWGDNNILTILAGLTGFTFLSFRGKSEKGSCPLFIYNSPTKFGWAKIIPGGEIILKFQGQHFSLIIPEASSIPSVVLPYLKKPPPPVDSVNEDDDLKDKRFTSKRKITEFFKIKNVIKRETVIKREKVKKILEMPPIKEQQPDPKMARKLLQNFKHISYTEKTNTNVGQETLKFQDNFENLEENIDNIKASNSKSDNNQFIEQSETNNVIVGEETLKLQDNIVQASDNIVVKQKYENIENITASSSVSGDEHYIQESETNNVKVWEETLKPSANSVQGRDNFIDEQKNENLEGNIENFTESKSECEYKHIGGSDNICDEQKSQDTAYAECNKYNYSSNSDCSDSAYSFHDKSDISDFGSDAGKECQDSDYSFDNSIMSVSGSEADYNFYNTEADDTDLFSHDLNSDYSKTLDLNFGCLDAKDHSLDAETNKESLYNSKVEYFPDNNKPYILGKTKTCDICEFKVNKKNWKHHLKSHSIPQTNAKATCSSKTPSSEFEKKAKLTEEKNQMASCSICQKTMKQKFISRHKKQIHTMLNQQNTNKRNKLQFKVTESSIKSGHKGLSPQQFFDDIHESKYDNLHSVSGNIENKIENFTISNPEGYERDIVSEHEEIIHLVTENSDVNTDDISKSNPECNEDIDESVNKYDDIKPVVEGENSEVNNDISKSNPECNEDIDEIENKFDGIKQVVEGETKIFKKQKYKSLDTTVQCRVEGCKNNEILKRNYKRHLQNEHNLSGDDIRPKYQLSLVEMFGDKRRKLQENVLEEEILQERVDNSKEFLNQNNQDSENSVLRQDDDNENQEKADLSQKLDRIEGRMISLESFIKKNDTKNETYKQKDSYNPGGGLDRCKTVSDIEKEHPFFQLKDEHVQCLLCITENKRFQFPWKSF